MLLWGDRKAHVLSIFDTPSYNDVKRRVILGVVMTAAKKERCE